MRTTNRVVGGVKVVGGLCMAACAVTAAGTVGPVLGLLGGLGAGLCILSGLYAVMTGRMADE